MFDSRSAKAGEAGPFVHASESPSPTKPNSLFGVFELKSLVCDSTTLHFDTKILALL